jgi:hypothetical protein
MELVDIGGCAAYIMLHCHDSHCQLFVGPVSVPRWSTGGDESCKCQLLIPLTREELPIATVDSVTFSFVKDRPEREKLTHTGNRG